MGAPYTSVTVSGYNSNPPSDDGSQTEANRVKWSTIKTKLPDPLKTAIEAVNTNTLGAFGKVIGGGGVTTTAITYQVLAADQGKLVQATVAGITVTTPNATSVGAPFVFAFLNTSSGAVTFDGSGAQTVDGTANLTVPTNSGFLCFTDGSNWFTTGTVGVLAGKQLRAGEIINATITESNLGNAATYSLKTLAGADPSATDPVLICFRNATSGTGNYVYRTVTAATTLVISSGSTLGLANSQPFALSLVLFDDAGTIRLGVINPESGPLSALTSGPIASSTAEGGAGAADSARTFYTGTAVSSKAYAILARATYSSGLATAGTWNVSPTELQLFGDDVSIPGTIPAWVMIQTQSASSSAQIDFTVGLDDLYDAYEIRLSNVKPATDDVELWLRVGTGATPTYQVTLYDWSLECMHGAPANGSNASDAKFVMSQQGAAVSNGNAAGENGSYSVRFNNPDASDMMLISYDGSYVSADGNPRAIYGGGAWVSTTPITAIRFLFETGNIASGRFTLYGLTKA